MLNNYEELLQNRSICEGRCVMGEECPTGICRSRNQNPAAHQSRSRKQRSVRSRSEMTRSPSTTSTASTSKARPRSGPAGLRSLTGAHKIIVVMVRDFWKYARYCLKSTVLSRFWLRHTFSQAHAFEKLA